MATVLRSVRPARDTGGVTAFLQKALTEDEERTVLERAATDGWTVVTGLSKAYAPYTALVEIDGAVYAAKFNENHDEHGRFTTGSSTGSNSRSDWTFTRDTSRDPSGHSSTTTDLPDRFGTVPTMRGGGLITNGEISIRAYDTTFANISAATHEMGQNIAGAKTSLAELKSTLKDGGDCRDAKMALDDHLENAVSVPGYFVEDAFGNHAVGDLLRGYVKASQEADSVLGNALKAGVPETGRDCLPAYDRALSYAEQLHTIMLSAVRYAAAQPVPTKHYIKGDNSLYRAKGNEFHMPAGSPGGAGGQFGSAEAAGAAVAALRGPNEGTPQTGGAALRASIASGKVARALAALPPDARARAEHNIAMHDQMIADGKTTHQMWDQREGHDGQYDAGIQHALMGIVEQHFNDQVAGGAKQEGKLTVVGGLGGAGKTTLLDTNGEDLGINPRDSIRVNPDDFKGLMADAGMVPGYDGLTQGELSGQVHQTSSDMAGWLEEMAMSRGYNTLYDVTMGSPNKAGSILDRAVTKYGYDPAKATSLFVDVSVDKSLKSAMARWSKGETYTGRFLNPNIPAAMVDETGQYNSINRGFFEGDRARFGRSMVVNNEDFYAPIEHKLQSVQYFGKPATR